MRVIYSGYLFNVARIVIRLFMEPNSQHFNCNYSFGILMVHAIEHIRGAVYALDSSVLSPNLSLICE